MKHTFQSLRTTITCVLFVGILFVLGIGLWAFPNQDVTRTERRNPAAFPTAESLSDGTFSSSFESYLLDRFPGRITFRQLKALAQFDLFRQLDNNGIYIVDGYVSRYEGSYRPAAVQNAAKKFSYVISRLPEGCNSYFCVVPDKNYYLAAANGYPSFDYDALTEQLYAGLPEQTKIVDLFPVLSVTDYYRTDTHWDQSRLQNVVATLEEAMQLPASTQTYTAHKLSGFYGVYYGQAALPLPPESLTYLTSETLDQATAQILNEKTLEFDDVPVYDEENFSHVDPYDVFLHGAQSVVKVQNPNADTDKRLILFRDSYGSSLAPLLLEHYAEIVLVDFRYLNYQFLDSFVEIQPGDDVLFLYSTLLLTNSDTLQIVPTE